MINHYQNKKNKILSVEVISKSQKILTISFKHSCAANQFYILGFPGFGENTFYPINNFSTHKLHFLIQSNQNSTLNNKLFSLDKNDDIYIRGPYYYDFNINNIKNKKITFIADNSGITCIQGMLEYLCKHSLNNQIQLFYEVNKPEEVLFKKFLQSNKKYIESLITIVSPNKNYRGNTGFIDKLITKNTILKNPSVVICISPDKQKKIFNKLLLLKTNTENIHFLPLHPFHYTLGDNQSDHVFQKLFQLKINH